MFKRQGSSTHVILILVKDEVLQPCNPSPCGANAICKELNGAGSCSCLPEYYGDPYSGCRPECVTNNDCPSDRACLNNKCKDPCPGVCGQNALCQVVKHTPSCTCLEGYTGNPFSACHEPPPPPSKNYCYYSHRTFNNITTRANFIIQNKISNRVYHHLADRIVSVVKSTIMLSVLVCRTLLAQHQIVALNV